MFSEYASRFLAQSQSRLSFAPSPDRERRQGHERSRRPDQGTWRSATASRINGQRTGNPYRPTSSQLSGFPFVSRLNNAQQAPLFFSATDEFREENDEEEHEREIADFYALQKSRRHLGGSDLRESSEVDEASGSSLNGNSYSDGRPEDRLGRGAGIRSSWRGGVTSGRGRSHYMDDLEESPELTAQDGRSDTGATSQSKMSDIRLEDTMRSDADDEPPEDLMGAAPVQRFRSPLLQSSIAVAGVNGLLPGHIPTDTGQDSVPELVPSHSTDKPRHDVFWGHLYLLAFCAMWATWFVVFLHTEAPDNNKFLLGDTVYTMLHGSFHLLAIYTIVSVFVSLFWLAALRDYVRQLVYGIVIAVPTVLYAFFLYPFITSFRPSSGRDKTTFQDKVMAWSSLVPAALASLWVIAVVRGRYSMQKAISILEFATKILAANPALLVVGFSVLAAVVGFTWIWLIMFTRVFLSGHLSTASFAKRFIIDAGTWWLGVYFILVYLWTIGMIFGLQRAITSATVSQWYFHRLAVPSPSSQTIVKAAVNHSVTTLFGTVALATGLSLFIRLPLLILPRRLMVLLSIAMFSLIPTPVATLINPLSLTYAAIHSQPLAVSARGLTQLRFLAPGDATTSLHPNTFHRNQGADGWSRDGSPLLLYRLVKLLLHATRFMMSLALGFGGWVSTARSLKLAGTGGVRGSLYAYIVGFLAGAIGWAILGAMEGVIACIVDAVIVCWASEVGSSGQGEVRYCREAAYLFGEDQDDARRHVDLA